MWASAVPGPPMVAWFFEILIEAPLVSAAAWFLLAALQIYRDRLHTWTESFFLFCCFLAGLYAIGDWLLFHSVSAPYAKLSALVSLTGLTLAVNFFLLFTLVYVDRMRRAYWALIVLSVVMLLLVFRFGITMINPPTADAPLFVPVFDFAILGIYLAYILTYSIVGIRNLYRLYQIVRKSSVTLARRAAGLMVTFTLVLVLGLSTNGILGLTGNQSFPPPLSTLLIFVAASAYYTLVIEQARYCYLTVVLEGEETDQLRRQMRDVLITFEAQNRPALQKWQGVPSEARGTEQLLTGFFVESPLV